MPNSGCSLLNRVFTPPSHECLLICGGSDGLTSQLLNRVLRPPTVIKYITREVELCPRFPVRFNKHREKEETEGGVKLRRKSGQDRGVSPVTLTRIKRLDKDETDHHGPPAGGAVLN